MGGAALYNFAIYKSVLNKLSESIAVISKEYELLWFNAAYASDFELVMDIAPTVGAKLPDLLAKKPQYLNNYLESCDRALNGDTFEYVRYETQTGQHYLVRYEPLLDEAGKIFAVLQVVENVTYQHQISNTFQRSSAMYRTVLRSIPIQIFTQDRDLRYIWAFAPSLDIDDSDFIGKTDDDLLERPEEAQYMRTIKLRVMQTGEPHSEVITLHQNDEPITMECFIDPLYNLDNSIAGVMVAALDVGERVTLKKELEQAELLRRSIEKERETIAMREQFVRMISHDFRTPLTVMMSSQQILRDYGDDLTSERRMRHIDKIGKQIDYMTTMLQEVSIFDRLRKNELDISYRPVSLFYFCRELLEDIEVATKSPCNYVFDAEESTQVVLIEYESVYRILSNVIGNAVKYSPKGGTIRFHLTYTEDSATFVISDEGMGISQYDLPHIFEPFRRAEAARINGIEGTGLGLAIVKLSVEACDGTISVKSTEGKGTTVTIHLPLQPPTQQTESV